MRLYSVPVNKYIRTHTTSSYENQDQLIKKLEIKISGFPGIANDVFAYFFSVCYFPVHFYNFVLFFCHIRCVVVNKCCRCNYTFPIFELAYHFKMC